MINLEAERAWLERLLREGIPLADAMKLRVARLDPVGIQLDFPLAPSINDKGSAFGGALASAMILAGWSLPRLLLRRRAISAELVIGRCELRFLKPVQGPYSAVCEWPERAVERQFLDRLAEHGKGRLELNARILAGDEVAAMLQARYAALITMNG